MKTTNKGKNITLLWLSCLFLAMLIILFTNNEAIVLNTPDWLIMALIFLVSAFCEYIDSSLGMGYGTTLTPLLLTFGAVRQEIIPVILLAELLSGFFSGIEHHRQGNIDLWKNRDVKIAFFSLAVPSIIGVLIATVLSTQLKSVGQRYANLYVGIMIVAIGLYLIYNYYFRSVKIRTISKPRLLTLGTIAAFNKGLSGGGYGPLMTGGQLTAGVKEKEAIVITSLCEGFTCLTGLIVFFLLGGSLNLFYVIPLCMGSVISVVPAVKTVKILPENVLKKAVGWATLLLGLLTLWKFLN